MAEAVAGTSKEGVNVFELIRDCAETAADDLYKDNVFEFTNGRYPRSFSRADIAIERRSPNAVFGQDMYRPGFEFLKMGIDGMGDCGLKEAYKRLEAFVRDRDLHSSCLEKVFNQKNACETSITAVMAVHLFGQLVAEDALIVDKRMKGLKELHNKCPCGCGARFNVGDTGIGVPRAWHGFADMLVHDVPVVFAKASEDGDKEEESVGESEEPPKKKCRAIESNLQQGDNTRSQLDQPSEMFAGTAEEVKRENLKSEVIITQMVATTIASSFAQGAEKPELEKKFLPAICCSKQGATIYMYNVDHDLFLNKCVDDFFNYVEEFQKTEFNLVLIIQIWFALNIYWTGCDADSVKSFLMKSGFQNKNERTIYKKAKLKISHFEDFGEKVVEDFFRVGSFNKIKAKQ